jgi:hypothetical protein
VRRLVGSEMCIRDRIKAATKKDEDPDDPNSGAVV